MSGLKRNMPDSVDPIEYGDSYDALEDQRPSKKPRTLEKTEETFDKNGSPEFFDKAVVSEKPYTECYVVAQQIFMEPWKLEQDYDEDSRVLSDDESTDQEPVTATFDL